MLSHKIYYEKNTYYLEKLVILMWCSYNDNDNL